MYTMVSTFIFLLWLLLNISYTENVQLPKDPNLIDLSYPINNQTLHFEEDIPVSIRIKYNRTRNFSASYGNFTFWYQGEEISFATHSGTHLDAPCHMARGQWYVNEIPIENLTDRPAAVVDITEKVKRNSTYQLVVQDILDWEAIYGQLPQYGVLLLQTGWGRFYPNLKLYGGYKKIHFLYPAMSVAVCQWLVSNRQLVGVAIEIPSPDNAYNFPQSHVVLLKANMYIVENIRENVKLLPRIGASVTFSPVKLESSCGAPVRVLAFICPRIAASCLV